MNYRLIFILLSFLWISSAYSGNEPVYFKRLTTQEGLSNGWVRCIYQDDFDFMWFGTSDGLNRYDGISFKNYKPRLADGTEQGNFTVNAILKKDDENLWICTDLGLYIFNLKSDEFLLNSILKKHFPILTCFYDQQHNLWLGSDRGVFKINPDLEVENFYTNNESDAGSISNNYVNRVFIDKKNRVWIGTKNGLNLYQQQTDNFKRLYVIENATNYGGNDVLAIDEDGLGRMWIGTALYGTNLLVEENGTYSLLHILDGVAVDLLVDKANYVWLGSKEGVARINANKLTFNDLDIRKFRYNPNDTKSISENTIVCIFEDRNSDIWIGTFGKGVNFYSKRDKKFRIVEEIYGSDQSIINNMVNGFFEDDNYLWIATEGGLDRYDKKTEKYKHYIQDPNDPHSLASNGIFDIYKDRRGNMWIGSWAGGLHRYDFKHDRFDRFLPTGKPGDISNANVFSIAEDQRGNLCVATNGGGLNFFDYKTETFKALTFREGDTCTISQNFMDFVLVTSNGDLLASVYSSVEKYNYETDCFQKFQYHPDRNSVEYHGNNIVILEDSRKNLWFGTERGLIVYKTINGESVLYTIADGLSNNTIQSIEEDYHGNLWLGTSKGLSEFVSAVTIPEKPEFINFSILDGLPSNDFKRRSSFKNNEGFLYFGTSSGFLTFHPDSIQFNTDTPKMAISELELLHPKAFKKNKLGPVINNINYYDKIELKYGFADFSINFATLNFLHPEGNKYKYKLEGYDKEWIYPENRNRVTYTNIKPGDYTFLVYGSNNDGVWSKFPGKLKIKILSPWWNTLWFKLIITIIILSIIAEFFHLRLSLLKKRNLLLQEKVEERTGELVKLNNQLISQKDVIEDKNKELFKHKNRLEELVDERTQELVKALNQVEESDRLKSSFLANMSHEIRTPLNSIMGFSSLLPEETSPEVLSKYSEIILSNSEQLLSIIDGIVLYSKLQTGLYYYQPLWFEAGKLLRDIHQSFDLSLYHKKATLVYDFKIEETTQIYSDYDKIRQVITNLISNAFKYSTAGLITVGCFQKEDLIEFYVKDTGIGIPKDDLNRIFERFFRGSNINISGTRGTGLGLSIVKELVELLYGAIWVESEVGKGSTFFFTIPVSRNSN